MFDKTTLVLAPTRDQHHHHRTEVHEHRAPTDESVRLLREMEQKMRDRVLDSIHVADTPLEFALYHLRPVHAGLDTEFAMRCKVKGQKLDVRHIFESRIGETEEQARERCIEELTQALATQLASIIVRAALAMQMRHHPLRLT
jgi:hypothetical protein